MSPTMSTCTPVSECFESIVPKSDNQIDCGPLPSPPSPFSSTLSQEHRSSCTMAPAAVTPEPIESGFRLIVNRPRFKL